MPGEHLQHLLFIGIAGGPVMGEIMVDPTGNAGLELPAVTVEIHIEQLIILMDRCCIHAVHRRHVGQHRLERAP